MNLIVGAAYHMVSVHLIQTAILLQGYISATVT